jgi:hypothetical protein
MFIITRLELLLLRRILQSTVQLNLNSGFGGPPNEGNNALLLKKGELDTEKRKLIRITIL